MNKEKHQPGLNHIQRLVSEEHRLHGLSMCMTWASCS